MSEPILNLKWDYLDDKGTMMLLKVAHQNQWCLPGGYGHRRQGQENDDLIQKRPTGAGFR